MSPDPETIDLLRFTQEIHNEQFPGNQTSVDYMEAMSFRLGIPVDQVDYLIDFLGQEVERRLPPDPDLNVIFHRTLLMGFEVGAAAERRARLQP